MRIAVLALQGAFAEHEQMLQRLGVETFQIRQLADWEQPKDGLIIPGGESTVQAKLLSDLHLLELSVTPSAADFPSLEHVPDSFYSQSRLKASLQPDLPLWTRKFSVTPTVVSSVASIP